MKPTGVRRSLGAAALTVVAIPALAQSPAPPPEPVELYHVHVVQAAPGSLSALLEAYRSAPGPDKGDPQVDPVILRHREGGEWDLVVFTPLGTDHTLRVDVPLPPEVQQFNQKVGALSAWHADSFVIGPPWERVRKALVPAAGAQPVYVVSDYRSLPGHRPQLRQVLDGLDQQAPDHGVLFAHAEGAPWNFLSVTRYDSWADLGRQDPPAAGQPEPGMALREHTSVHHDTVAVYVSGGRARP